MLNSLDIAKEPSQTRVVVAMSGGVDSSVVAAMMQREGYDVIGITLQLYDHGAAVHRKGACCAGQDIHDARRVAEMLGIPHYVLDYESRFREAVIDNFADSYLAGETPDPLRRMQPLDQVQGSPRHRAGARCGRARHRPLRREPRAARWPAGALPRARSFPRPELFPLCHDARTARHAALPAGRAGKRARRARLPASSGWSWPKRPTARISASCPTAITPMSSPS